MRTTNMEENCPKCGREMVPACPICGKRVEVYSRICGYLTPLSRWNDGKAQEFIERKTFTLYHGDHIDE